MVAAGPNPGGGYPNTGTVLQITPMAQKVSRRQFKVSPFFRFDLKRTFYSSILHTSLDNGQDVDESTGFSTFSLIHAKCRLVSYLPGSGPETGVLLTATGALIKIEGEDCSRRHDRSALNNLTHGLNDHHYDSAESGNGLNPCKLFEHDFRLRFDQLLYC
ncbi:hypothetical protein Pan161_28040 [Gimesia algae]|uniref:Uncharacterized protein n=1 Tax=Gimesia algae TaxID=2527971 RepID=A0A517VDT0_9PLAN|nr:hypothetical protein Pan161_28040 [Gimesia algae]